MIPESIASDSFNKFDAQDGIVGKLRKLATDREVRRGRKRLSVSSRLPSSEYAALRYVYMMIDGSVDRCVCSWWCIRGRKTNESR